MVLRDQLYVVYGDRGHELLIAGVGKVIPECLGGVGGKGGSASLAEALTTLSLFITLTERELGFIIEGRGSNFGTLYFVRDPDTSLDSCRMAADRPASAEVDHVITSVKPQHVVKKVGGRKSWLYSSRLGDREVFVKVEVQNELRQSEIDIMQKLLDNNVPHTARMLHGFKFDSHNGFRTEVMVLEDHGLLLCKFFSYFDSRRRLNQDTVSAVVRQIITAIFGAYRAKILHRDVSAGNIVARMRNGEVEATLIDWGYARLVPVSHDPNSNPNNNMIVGTMAFRSLRMVNGCSGRIIIDEIESVFYVVCYGLVHVYANGRLGNIFWDMS
ncbi:hypothetical protein EV182_001977 [Spiromyces aspiralis]|uniref:Uncharacterized protein n=1 Tax=Spiromyces aspiralis TaxID=68401 RepID=A0ACC1HYI5_9FUNG|nr:hypothetical protein EV182_001977 [Spiromyces aspiralis]